MSTTSAETSLLNPVPLTPMTPTTPMKHPKPALWAALSALLRWVAGLTAVILGLLVIAWLVIHWAILPHIENWRGTVEQRASAALGVPVRIGGITVTSSGWVPAFELRDVALLGPDAQPALSLPRVVAALSPRSLLALELRFEQLLIENAQLDVQRDAQGRLRIAGLDMSAPATGPAADAAVVTDWFFKQHELVIRGASVRWSDAQHAGPPLVLSNVQFVMRNGLRQHDFRLDGTPPVEWGDRFSLSGKFTQPLLARPGDWQRWSGAVHADLPRADLRELRRHVDLPLDLSQGHGAVRAWLQVRSGKLTEGVADVALRTVVLRLGPQLQALTFDHLQGRLVAQQQADTLRLSTEKFSFAVLKSDDKTSGAAWQWPGSDMSLLLRCERTCAPGEAARAGEFNAQRLDLGLMAEMAQHLPLTDGLRKHLTELRPQGLVTGLSTRWDGPVDAPTAYQVKALFSGFSLAARPGPDVHALGRPGLSGATVDLSANEKGGQAQVTLAPGGTVDLPGVFAETVVPFDQLSSVLQWRIEPGKASGAVQKTATAKAAKAVTQTNNALLPKITLSINSTRFANADFQGELTGTWSSGAGDGFARGGRYPGDLEINGKLSRGVAVRTARYLPLGLPQSARNYAGRSLQGGTFSAVSFRVKGDLWDFPYFDERFAKSPKDGQLRVAATLADVNFAYVPSLPASGAQPAFESPWPALSKVSGELVFDRASLEVRNAKARWAGLDITQVQGGIRSLADKSVLVLDGQARGPLADMLRFVNSSPVGLWTGKVLAQSSATGNAELKLGLNIPLFDVPSASVTGSVAVAGNELRIQPDNPLLSAVKGRVDFTQKGFTVVGGSAKLWGGDVSFDGGTTADGAVRFVGNGNITADGLRRASELGWVTRLAGALSGQTSYRAALGFTRNGPELTVTSNLVGMAADLPAPLRKVSEAVLPLRYQTTMLAEPGGASTATATSSVSARDQLRFDLGSVVRAQYVRDVSGDVPRVLRGGVSVTAGGVDVASAPTPASGVTANVNVPVANLDAWEAATTKLFGASAATVTPTLADAAASTTSTAPQQLSGYFPTSITLRTPELLAASRRLNRVVAGVSQEDGVWRANVDAEQLSGYVEYRAGPVAGTGTSPTVLRRNPTVLEAKGEAKVFARLSRLSLPRSELEETGSALVTATNASPNASLNASASNNVPALDIVVDDLELRGKHLGRVEVLAANRLNAEGAREWQLSRLVMSLPEAKLSATGTWAPVLASPSASTSASASAENPRGRKRMSLNFKLDLADSGALLERLVPAPSTPSAAASSASGSISKTNTKTLNGGKGVLAGQVAWLGSPLALDIPSLSGQMNLTLENGQFLKVDPGAGRLLSVLSLQSLPRRLALDFRDVFQQGFAFDNLAGDISMTQGVARTNNLRLRGSLAAVLMEGSADIAAESQNLRVIVVPEVNAGTASLAYAVINPAVGLATFLAQVFLRQPLIQANTREFQISGSWSDPKVERMERKLNEAVPDIKLPDARAQEAKPQQLPAPSQNEPASAAAAASAPAPVLQ